MSDRRTEMSDYASTTATASDQGADMTINASIAATETSEGVASLPNELKSIIIGHYVQFPRIITWKSHGSLFRLRAGPFLVDKFFGEAAQRIYYGANLFHIEPDDITRCRFPSHAMGHRIRHLKATMDCEIPRSNLFGYLDPIPEPESIEPPDWMLRFSGLETLDIELVDPMSANELPTPQEWQSRCITHYSALISAMDRRSIAKAVKITLIREGCLWALAEHKDRDCDCCEEFLERVTRGVGTEVTTGVLKF